MTLTTRIAALALAFTSTFALASSPADACGDYGSFRRAAVLPKQAPERITGTVVAFRGMPAVRLGSDARLTIQYPTFKSSGDMLYMIDVHVPAEQLRPLQRALAAQLAKGPEVTTGRAGVELEQVSAHEWRLVSWTI